MLFVKNTALITQCIKHRIGRMYTFISKKKRPKPHLRPRINGSFGFFFWVLGEKYSKQFNGHRATVAADVMLKNDRNQPKSDLFSERAEKKTSAYIQRKRRTKNMIYIYWYECEIVNSECVRAAAQWNSELTITYLAAQAGRKIGVREYTFIFIYINTRERIQIYDIYLCVYMYARSGLKY